mmetsp:Transcript_9571/g.22686  ORF Transcript_9571/g.22686 Transcript_9571/m.22686 type:complete len:218 (-) Transcript_9571:383-1036(-)
MFALIAVPSRGRPLDQRRKSSATSSPKRGSIEADTALSTSAPPCRSSHPGKNESGGGRVISTSTAVERAREPLVSALVSSPLPPSVHLSFVSNDTCKSASWMLLVALAGRATGGGFCCPSGILGPSPSSGVEGRRRAPTADSTTSPRPPSTSTDTSHVAVKGSCMRDMSGMVNRYSTSRSSSPLSRREINCSSRVTHCSAGNVMYLPRVTLSARPRS